MATSSTTSSTSSAAQTTLSALQAKRASAQKIVTSLNAGSGVDVVSLAQGLADAERIPQENMLNGKISKNEARVSGYSAISFMLKGVRDAVTALKDANSFNTSNITNANPSAFGATSTTSAAAGNYAVKVNSLAQPQRSISGGFATALTSLNDGVGFSLSLSVNGGAASSITVAQGADTPQGVVDAINAAKKGVTARLVNTGDAVNPFKIALTSETGAAQNFQLFSPPVKSLRFATPEVALPNTLKLSLSLNGATPFTLLDGGGTTAHTPRSMAAAINAANLPVSARLVYIKADGSELDLAGNDTVPAADLAGDTADRYRVIVTSKTSPPAEVAITSTPVESLYVSPVTFAVTQAASNASLTVDGVDYTRSSNSVTDVINGVTLDLKATTTAASGLTLTRDTAQVKEKITALITAYNEANEILNEVTNPKSELEQYGATLVGDSVARQVKNQLRDMLLGQSSSPGTSVGALWQMGISIDKSGVMSVDSTKLDKALANNFADVVTTFTANQNNRSATSPPVSTSGGFASNLQPLNGGAAFSLTLTGSSGTVGIPVSAAQATPQGVVDAINASNAGYTAQLINDGGATPFKILVMGSVGSSSFSLSASSAGTAVSGLSFSSAGSGIAGDALRKITALLSPTGPLLSQSEGANAQNVKLKASLAALQERMQGVLERYTKQFATMESLVGNINSQKTSLKSSFEGMMAMYTNK